ncbi:MAG: Potassium channel [Alectoria fallacina]|uniref:Potassium channel n=1 Tax=Alectoria fallacina TaxID=1903189 RepID=A0A8H3J5L3_9LECA|nr:MAG: Potassium channel [Alectoria fallacina]
MGTGESSPGSSDNTDASTSTLPRSRSESLTAAIPVKQKWKFYLRPDDDDQPQDWWFCSTAIPLLAATTGPLANVMSIAALVTSWRNNYDPANPGIDADSIGFPDPRWCLGLNGASLACGFAGNIFLLFNFTRRIRYIVALPVTIILWYFATGILIAITASMDEYVPPHRPEQTYSQGFWHAVIAAILYLVSSMILMLNMLGYFLGHYPQHFELSDDQRNLILQTMMFFFWLAGGAAVFAKVEGWSYVDSLYFCDVTVLTVGFGDFYPTNDVGRGLVFPYSVGGIIILGLMVSSIRGFAQELGSTHVVKSHVEKQRTHTLQRTATTDFEYEALKAHALAKLRHKSPVPISESFDLTKRTINFDVEKAIAASPHESHQKNPKVGPVTASLRVLRRVGSRQPKILLMRQEKDRFDAMRKIQYDTHKFKRYSALTMSFIAFGLLWCVGAVGFWGAESKSQGLSYFEALYFCYVSLLTIGYGDLSPKSNAGKPLFIVWSLIAVPTMTILISDMGDTVIASFKRGTFKLADWTVLPKAGLWRELLEKYPWLLLWLQKKSQKAAEKRRLAAGMPVGPEEDGMDPAPTMEQVSELDNLDDQALAGKLAIAIRHTANHLKDDPPRIYCYEEWAEYTRLIRFSRLSKEEIEEAEEEQGIVEWDWIGEDSPMIADSTESEWVLDRLCESLNRYMRKQGMGVSAGDKPKDV